jgi:hypothetical protein
MRILMREGCATSACAAIHCLAHTDFVVSEDVVLFMLRFARSHFGSYYVTHEMLKRVTASGKSAHASPPSAALNGYG